MAEEEYVKISKKKLRRYQIFELIFWIILIAMLWLNWFVLLNIQRFCTCECPPCLCSIPKPEGIKFPAVRP